MNYKLFDVIKTTVDFPDQKIKTGEIGTIVDVYEDGEFEVEFLNENGETIAMFAVTSDQIAPSGIQLKKAA